MGHEESRALDGYSAARRSLLKSTTTAIAGVAVSSRSTPTAPAATSTPITNPQTMKGTESASGSGLSPARLSRLHDVMAGYFDRGEIPGIVTLVSRRGEVHVDAIGRKAFGAASAPNNGPMRRDTIFRIASMSKPITAAAAMILVEECKVRLDEPVDRLLPELANRKVLKRLDGPLEDTVPAKRPITVRDLLTFRLGFGFTMELFSGNPPIVRAMQEQKLTIGPIFPDMPPDEYMRRLGTLPLMYQPGERWLYHTGSDVLGVLIARASGKTFEAFLRERIFDPLAMKDTGFSVPAAKLDRLPTAYQLNPGTRTLEIFDDPRNSKWSRTPSFQSGGGGLVSTVDDYLAFSRMMLDLGRIAGRNERILSRPSVELMITNQLTPEQKAGSFLPDWRGWGFGLSVGLQRADLAETPGRFGWDGGYGTSCYSDPKEDLVGILMTQRLLTSPSPPDVFVDFWTAAYGAIDD